MVRQGTNLKVGQRVSFEYGCQRRINPLAYKESCQGTVVAVNAKTGKRGAVKIAPDAGQVCGSKRCWRKGQSVQRIRS